MNSLLQALQRINWDFSDYNSSKYPLDINSIPWYPATFIPPIPKFLTALFTQPGDVILDPFGGKGTTTVETIKLGRFPIYNDINPFAVEITRAIVLVIKKRLQNQVFLDNENDLVENYKVDPNISERIIHEFNINRDIFKWYEEATLNDLLCIVDLMYKKKAENEEAFLIRKFALSSILKPASSQHGHFTYVTDNCKPTELIRKEAKKMYIDRINQILHAADDLIHQFKITNPNDNLQTIIDKSLIHAGDARKLDWIKDNSVNLVITSPPYLCAQDYIKTMRLTNLFFPNNDFNEKPRDEIGPRSKRSSNSKIVVEQFYSDMNLVFSEIERVLADGGYFCFIFGQGKTKITSSYDTISDLHRDIIEKYSFAKIYQTERKISNRAIQVGGVDKETILIFQKKDGGKQNA
jgi:DNA modification methylase